MARKPSTEAHKIVDSGLVRVSDAGARRTFVKCSCGKRFTGWGATALYTHTRHARQEEK